MTNEQQYEEDYRKTREEVLAITLGLICTGCTSAGAAAAVIGAARSVLAAVMTYAADGKQNHRSHHRVESRAEKTWPQVAISSQSLRN